MPDPSDTEPVDPAEPVEPAEPVDPAERVEQLRATIRYHNRRYYELDEPEIPDAEWDALDARAASPSRRSTPTSSRPDSPTRVVGGPASTTFAPVVHACR